MKRVELLNGDCLDILKWIENDSIDSLVTDPPAGISFMGKDWDSDKGGREHWIAWMTLVMSECLRVMKPGAHGLVWALPRTSHWTATALEEAGFEIRDVVTHLFGTGFPKSLDVSKAIDKAAGAEREVLGPNPSAIGRKSNKTGGNLIGGQTSDRELVDVITAPATEAAKTWQGWGTALKPASEHWILIRKPCSEKTVAANVLKWGTGALNIDECRVAVGEETLARPPLSTNKHEGYKRPWNEDPEARARAEASKALAADKAQSLGRFPANLVLDEEAAQALDEQSGALKSGSLKPYKQANRDGYSGSMPEIREVTRDASEGGASRFFYVAKASKKDKGADNTHPTVKSTELMSYLIRLVTPPGGLVLDPFMGSGSTGVSARRRKFRFIGIEKNQSYFKIAKARNDESSFI